VFGKREPNAYLLPPNCRATSQPEEQLTHEAACLVGARRDAELQALLEYIGLMTID
jgi:hypothetical protein